MTEEDFMVDPIKEFEMNYKNQSELADPEKRKTRHYTVNFVGPPFGVCREWIEGWGEGREGCGAVEVEVEVQGEEGRRGAELYAD